MPPNRCLVLSWIQKGIKRGEVLGLLTLRSLQAAPTGSQGPCRMVFHEQGACRHRSPRTAGAAPTHVLSTWQAMAVRSSQLSEMLTWAPGRQKLRWKAASGLQGGSRRLSVGTSEN